MKLFPNFTRRHLITHTNFAPLSSLDVNLVITEITVRCNATKALLVPSVKELASVLTTQPVTRQMVHATVCQGG